MVLGKLPVPGRPTVWITVGQGSLALAVGAGCLDIFTLIFPFSPVSPSLWETARYRLKYCLKGPLNLKQPTNQKPRTRSILAVILYGCQLYSRSHHEHGALMIFLLTITVDSRYLERGPLKHFEISVLRHIRLVVLRKKNHLKTKIYKWLCNLTPLIRNIYWKYCGKGEKLLPMSNFSSFPQYFATWFEISVLKQGPDFLFEISGYSR